MTESTLTPPAVMFRESQPLQDYYFDGSGAYWSVAKLLDDARNLPVFDAPLAALDLSGVIWEGSDMYTLAFHVKKCMDADLEFPILLDWRGSIADGRHRVLKAIAEGRTTIKAKRMTWRPEPCGKEKDA